MKVLARIFAFMYGAGYFLNGFYILYLLYVVAVKESFILALTPIGWLLAIWYAITSWPFWVLLAWTALFMFAGAKVESIASNDREVVTEKRNKGMMWVTITLGVLLLFAVSGFIVLLADRASVEPEWTQIGEYVGESINIYEDYDSDEMIQKTTPFEAKTGKLRITSKIAVDEKGCTMDEDDEIVGQTSIFVYPEGEDKYVESVKDNDCNGEIHQEISIEPGSYYLKIITYFDWKITVEEYK